MEQPIKRTCPQCGASEYKFRGRKNIPAAIGKPACMETKYRCKACNHIWAVVSEASYLKKPSGHDANS